MTVSRLRCVPGLVERKAAEDRQNREEAINQALVLRRLKSAKPIMLATDPFRVTKRLSLMVACPSRFCLFIVTRLNEHLHVSFVQLYRACYTPQVRPFYSLTPARKKKVPVTALARSETPCSPAAT